MIYAVIADVHANSEALERVLADAQEQGAESVVCLGDIVGYGPRPAEALALLRRCGAAAVAGNHDDAVAGRIDAGDFVDLAGEAVARHREALDAEALAWLRHLPYTLEFGGAAAAHGDFTAPESFNYIEDAESAAGSFAVRAEQLMFVGHTHVPGIFLTGNSGRIYATGPQDFTLEPGKRYIVNPGSVGYPREAHGECYSSYVLYDSEEGSVRFRMLPFSVASVMQRGRGGIRRRFGLPVWIGAVAAVGAAILLPFVMRTPPPPPSVAVPADDVVTNAVIWITSPPKSVNPGLKLAKPYGCEVAVRVDFFAVDGARLASTDVKTVKQRCDSASDFAVPRTATNAVKAVVQVLRKRPGDRPCIDKFSPQLLLRGKTSR